MHGTSANSTLSKAIGVVVTYLNASLDWTRKAPTLKQKLCLEFLITSLKRIPVSDVYTDWTKIYNTVLSQFGKVYCCYVRERKPKGGAVLLGELPSEVQENPSSSMEYFQLIQKIHKVLKTWKSQLDCQSANYDLISAYREHYRYIHNVATAVSATGLVFNAFKLDDVQQSFLQQFEDINRIFLKYIHNDPKAGW